LDGFKRRALNPFIRREKVEEKSFIKERKKGRARFLATFSFMLQKLNFNAS